MIHTPTSEGGKHTSSRKWVEAGLCVCNASVRAQRRGPRTTVRWREGVFTKTLRRAPATHHAGGKRRARAHPLCQAPLSRSLRAAERRRRVARHPPGSRVEARCRGRINKNGLIRSMRETQRQGRTITHAPPITARPFGRWHASPVGSTVAGPPSGGRGAAWPGTLEEESVCAV